MPIIQDFVPRHESFRMQLSRRSWDQGVANHFFQNVPWQYTTSHYLAGQIMHLVREYMTENNALPIMELGAGCGLFSKRLIDQIHAEYPSWVANGGRLIITDSSNECMTPLRESPLFRAYGSAVDIRVLSVADDWMAMAKSPRLVVCASLIDATPVRQIVVKNGQAHEYWVQTTMPESSMATAGATTMADLLGHPDAYILGKGWVKLLDEHVQIMPLPDDLQAYAFNDYIRDRQLPDGAVFNAHPVAMDAILRGLQSSAPVTIVATDIGLGPGASFPTDPQQWLSNYGICTFSSVAFDWMSWMIERQGWHSRSTAHTAQTVQTMIISNQPLPDTPWLSACDLSAYQALTQQQTIPPVSDSVADIQSAVTQTMPYFYSVSACVMRLMEKQAYDAVIRAIQQVSDWYGIMSAPLLTVLGWAYIQKNDLKMAVLTFQYVLGINPYESQAYLGLVTVYKQQGKSDMVAMYQSMLDQL